MGGVRASRTLPTICIHSCNVAQVSLHAPWGSAGQTSLGGVGVTRSVSIAPRSDDDTAQLFPVPWSLFFDLFKCFAQPLPGGIQILGKDARLRNRRHEVGVA